MDSCGKERMEVNIGWQFPAYDWVKFNSDGLVQRNQLARYGSVDRDGTGSWLLGFTKNL